MKEGQKFMKGHELWDEKQTWTPTPPLSIP